MRRLQLQCTIVEAEVIYCETLATAKRWLDMDDIMNKATYVQAVLLGDGALVLPEPPPVNIATTIPKISLMESFTNKITNYQVANLPPSGVPQYTISDDKYHDIHSVNITKEGYEENTAETILSKKSSFFLDDLAGDQLVLNKIIDENSKEAWHYSVVNKAEIKIDGQMDDWALAYLAASGASNNIKPACFDLTSVYTIRSSDFGYQCQWF